MQMTDLRRFLLHLAAVLLLAVAAPAHALCTIVCSCSVSTSNVTFGNHNPLSSTNNDAVGNVRVACAGVVGLAIPYRIDITKGSGPSYANRRLTSGVNTMAYNLYTDINRTLVWGDGTGSTSYGSGNIGLDVLGTSPPVDHPVYGRIPGPQTTVVPSLTPYTDSISVTLTYY